MAELADAPDSKSGSFGSPGSNPGGSTNSNRVVRDKRFESSLVFWFLRGDVIAAYKPHKLEDRGSSGDRIQLRFHENESLWLKYWSVA